MKREKGKRLEGVVEVTFDTMGGICNANRNKYIVLGLIAETFNALKAN